LSFPKAHALKWYHSSTWWVYLLFHYFAIFLYP